MTETWGVFINWGFRFCYRERNFRYRFISFCKNNAEAVQK